MCKSVDGGGALPGTAHGGVGVAGHGPGWGTAVWNYHRVLNRARWSGLQGAKILLGLLILLVPASVRQNRRR